MNTCLPMVHILSPEVCSPTHHHQNHVCCLGLENAGRPKPEAHLPTWNCWNYSEQPTPRPGPLVQILPVSLHCWDYSPMGRIHRWSVQKKKKNYAIQIWQPKQRIGAEKKSCAMWRWAAEALWPVPPQGFWLRWELEGRPKVRLLKHSPVSLVMARLWDCMDR